MSETRLFEWDDAKDAENLRRGRPSFEEVAAFDFATALVRADLRQDYGEVRFQAIGFVGTRLYVLVYTERGRTTRVISFRKANDRETKIYDRETEHRHRDEGDHEGLD